MKKSFLAVMLVVVLTVCLAGVVASYAEYDSSDEGEAGSFYDDGTPEVYITVVNNSGWTFSGIWMRPSSNNLWQARDRFIVSDGRNMTLGNGEYVTLCPNSASRHGVRFWDIRVDYGKGKRREIRNIDVFNVDEIDIGRNFRVSYQR